MSAAHAISRRRRFSRREHELAQRPEPLPPYAPSRLGGQAIPGHDPRPIATRREQLRRRAAPDGHPTTAKLVSRCSVCQATRADACRGCGNAS